MLGVAWYGSDDSMQDFEERHGLTFPSLRDDDGALFAHFGVPAQPAWVFVSGVGDVTTHLGAMEPDELRATLTDLATA